MTRHALLMKTNETIFMWHQPCNISAGCLYAYMDIRRISSIRQFLTGEAITTLVSAFVLSKLDYCNALLSDCPTDLLSRIQKVHNSAAKLVLKARKRDYV